LREIAGQDATSEYVQFHHPSVMKKYHSRLCIGRIDGEQSHDEKRPVHIPGSFGDMVPYGDPSWYQRFNSPYYTDSHRKWREYVRAFCEKHIMPTIDEWKDNNSPPRELVREMGKAGLLAVMVGPPYADQYVDEGTPRPENYDYFHELITYDELTRCGSSSVMGALTNGPAIALTAVLRFGSEELKREVVRDVLMGEKFIALAISEPHIGSDVRGMITSAKFEGEGAGKRLVINGNKKWITNGMYADYHVTAVRTGGRGELSLVLVPSTAEGFSRRKVAIRGSDISGTAYLDFDNVRVPTSNIIGKVGDGFKMIMFNFNHERFYVTAIAARLSRVCLEESIRYALKRKTFGKPLAETQAIRMKIAAMARKVECLYSWLESLTYQMCTMEHTEANLKIGDVMCLCKAESSKVYEYCAREATMIFGGNALYVNGVGRKIEPAVNQVKGYQIPAGAEDVMDDFGARTAFKLAKRVAKL